MEEVTGRDNQIIREALSIAIPLMLRHSLAWSNTKDMMANISCDGLVHWNMFVVERMTNHQNNMAGSTGMILGKIKFLINVCRCASLVQVSKLTIVVVKFRV